jgi:hypothetical protein
MNEVEKRIKTLREYENRFYEVYVKIQEANNNAIYIIDLITVGIIKRSVSLLDAFCQLIETKNLLSAVSLVRLHLDSLLRLNAFSLVNDPNEVAYKVIKGDQLNKIKDRNNNYLRDRYLAEEMNKNYDWVLRVYEETSGFIHLSKKHYFYALTDVIEQDRSALLSISAKDDHITEQIIIEYLEAFKSISDLIIDHLTRWFVKKELPDILTKLNMNKIHKE